VNMLSADCSMPVQQRPGDRPWNPSQMLAEGVPSFDMPAALGNTDDLATKEAPATPRQQALRRQLELPVMDNYPDPPDFRPDETQKERERRLLEIYRGFALELHRGRYLTQLMGDRSYAEIHCQLMEDMSTLKLDQNNGRMIEFPLANVSEVYRLTKVKGKWQPAEKHASSPLAANSEQIIVVVFCKRKLAFVFKDLDSCSRFMLCLELLIWRAQQLEGYPLIRASFSKCCPASHKVSQVVHEEGGAGDDLAVRVQQLIATSHGNSACNTPRIVHDVETTPNRRISQVRQSVLDQFVEGTEALQPAEIDTTATSRRQRGRQVDVRREANTQRSQASRGSPATSSAPSPSFTAPAVTAEEDPLGEDVQASDSGSEMAKAPYNINEDFLMAEGLLEI